MAYNPDDKYSYQNDGTGIFKLKKQKINGTDINNHINGLYRNNDRT